MTQLGAAEGAAVDELVLMDDPSSNTFRQSQDVKVKISSWYVSLSVTFRSDFNYTQYKSHSSVSNIMPISILTF